MHHYQFFDVTVKKVMQNDMKKLISRLVLPIYYDVPGRNEPRTKNCGSEAHKNLRSAQDNWVEI